MKMRLLKAGGPRHAEYMRLAAFFFISFLIPLVAAAQTDAARVAQLEARVAELESRLATLEGIMLDKISSAQGPMRPSVAAANESRFYDDLRLKLFRSEVAVAMPWSQQANWERLRKGMSMEEVEAILGEPTRKLKSLMNRVDMVYFYRGDIAGTGVEANGEVRFYKDRLISLEMPDFDGRAE